MRTLAAVCGIGLLAAALAPVAWAQTGLQKEYAVATSPHVIVWRDGKAMDEGLKLIGQGVHKTHPELVMDDVACMPDSGTEISVTDGGFFSSTVLVVAGRYKGCRGVIDNQFINNSRKPKPPL